MNADQSTGQSSVGEYISMLGRSSYMKATPMSEVSRNTRDDCVN